MNERGTWLLTCQLELDTQLRVLFRGEKKLNVVFAKSSDLSFEV